MTDSHLNRQGINMTHNVDVRAYDFRNNACAAVIGYKGKDIQIALSAAVTGYGRTKQWSVTALYNGKQAVESSGNRDHAAKNAIRALVKKL